MLYVSPMSDRGCVRRRTMWVHLCSCLSVSVTFGCVTNQPKIQWLNTTNIYNFHGSATWLFYDQPAVWGGGLQKFPSHSSDNVGSLTCWATRVLLNAHLLILINFMQCWITSLFFENKSRNTNKTNHTSFYFSLSPLSLMSWCLLKWYAPKGH